MEPTWLIVSGDFTRTGGMDRANYHLAWYLAEQRGHCVHVAAFHVAEPLASHPNVRVHRVTRPLGSHFIGEFQLRRLGLRLARQLVAQNPDARVVVNGGNCPWPDANWVHIVHHAYTARDEGAPWHFRFRNRFFYWLSRWQERRALRAAQLLVANSEKTKRDLVDRLQLNPARIAVVYLGVDAAEFNAVTSDERRAARAKWGIPEHETVIAFVGALGYDRNKGFDTLLAAVGLLAKRGEPAPRVFAAGAGVLPYWQRKIHDIGMAKRVRLLGPIDHVRDLLAAADLLVSPTHFDAYGLGVHEALCRGIPAIVTRTAGVAERFPSALRDLLLENASDTAELAQRIGIWAERRLEFAEAARAFGDQLRSWTWNDMAAHLVKRMEAMSDARPRMSGGKITEGLAPSTDEVPLLQVMGSKR